MATVKSSCTACRKHTPHELVNAKEIPLPPGLSESYCVICKSWKIVITDEALADPFFILPPRRKKRGSSE